MKQIFPQVPAAQITIWSHLSKKKKKKKKNIFRKMPASSESRSFEYLLMPYLAPFIDRILFLEIEMVIFRNVVKQLW